MNERPTNRQRRDDGWRWRITLSGVALFWERLWRALWPSGAVGLLFAVIVLFDLLPLLPGWLHAAALAGFGLGVLVLLWRELRQLRMPGYGSARRRLETTNQLRHRPLEALDDQVVGGAEANPVARALWRHHQERLRQSLESLRVGAPSPRLIKRDPFALRFALAMGLVLGGITAGADAPARLERALSPHWAGAAAARAVVLDAWIAPPAYTGQPPVFLTSTGPGTQPWPTEEPIAVPQGSIFIAQVSGADSAPTVESAELADAAPGFESTGPDSYRARIVLEEGGIVAVRSGVRELGNWDVVVVPDLPPTVSFLSDPGQTVLGALKIEFEAHDDYALVSVKATVRRPGAAAGTDDVITFELPLPGVNASEAIGAGYQDLTPHPWAGLPVELRLIARDGRGQSGSSGALSLILPERHFSHPVARAIIEQRKRLTADPESARESVSEALRALAWEADAYDNDVVVFMALVSAGGRLEYSSKPESVAEVQEMLWDTALRLEDGNVSMAQRELRRVQQELMDALANGASDEELERLLDELQAALDELLDALAAMQMPNLEGVMPNPDALTLNRQDLQSMIDRLRDLARSGAKDAAREMLSQLQNLLENLRNGRMAQQQQQQDFSEAMKALNALQELIQGQQELLDRTFSESQRRDQQGAPQGRSPGDGGQGEQGEGDSADTVLQEALRRQLGELMRQFGEMVGEIPRPFGRAEGAMRRSTGALRADRPGAAVGPQTEALDQLQEAARQATEQLMQQFGRGQGQAMGRAPGMPFGQRDPFGRSMDGNQGFQNGDVEIPSESDVQRARRILEELRRRAGERDRPALERDYIDRLLKQF